MPGKLRIRFRVVFGTVIVVVGMAVFFGFRWMQFIGRDQLWKWRVRSHVKAEDLRLWAFQVLSNTAPDFRTDSANDMLTNAPPYLVSSDRHKPSVVPTFDCVHVIYGGGLYHWGLTIGDTNLPPESARGRSEQWAPGIYYWSN
jgi:hypothetical protein